MISAVCLKCGEPKMAPWEVCRACGFDPGDDEQALVKSVYLSLGRFDDEAQQQSYSQELREIGEQIQAGDAVVFDEAELGRLRQQKKLLDEVPSSAAWRVLWVVFRPAILLLLGMAVFVWVLRALR